MLPWLSPRPRRRSSACPSRGPQIVGRGTQDLPVRVAVLLLEVEGQMGEPKQLAEIDGLNGSKRLERVNVTLSPTDRVWLDQISKEVRVGGGAISRSEVTRAALAILRELHTLTPEMLRKCQSGSDLEVVGIAVVRSASLRWTRYTPTEGDGYGRLARRGPP